MAAKAKEKYLVEACFQSPGAHLKEVSMEIEASNGEQVWEAVNDAAKENGDTLLYARISQVDAETGEAITVRPLPKKEDAPKDNLLPWPKNIDRTHWWEDSARFQPAVTSFTVRDVEVEDDDTVTT